MKNGSPVDALRAWDAHWEAIHQHGSVFGPITSLVRRAIIAPAVRRYARRFFQESGVHVEAGCGTAQSSMLLDRSGRSLAALDFSLPALCVARRVPLFGGYVQGDIRRLPFRDGTVAGIWNLGVMEHFEPEEGQAILREFRRVLKPGAAAILFWPPEFGSSRFVLGPIEWLLSRLNRREVHFFPDEVNRLRSRRHALETLVAAGLEPAAVEFSARDFFIHLVVVARRPVA